MPGHTPRCILIRHGQTEWSKTGQYTSVTDLPLTEYGVRQMEITRSKLISETGEALIHPNDVKLIITSPRKRAIQTKEILFGEHPSVVDDDMREWEYGDYEGLLTHEIQHLRKQRGLESERWNIWEYGCENGEVASDVTLRVDRIIAKIRKTHAEYLARDESCDIVVVAHGHILRCFAARWIDLPVDRNPKFMLDAGGICVLSYQHHNIEEPALFLTGAFTVPVEEEGKRI
ncbi:hypothetical protein CANINC_001961 [Pichia inconspicua]|uniref:Phosphoglycerate mutase n=1 Tax=Pichia inconspicua TaxID=52247 RepID=A0A4T0X2U0_9ASCO|nr:hypothetical protein CANINC_001961 [[Candida] inconspicua]